MYVDSQMKWTWIKLMDKNFSRILGLCRQKPKYWQVWVQISHLHNYIKRYKHIHLFWAIKLFYYNNLCCTYVIQSCYPSLHKLMLYLFYPIMLFQARQTHTTLMSYNHVIPCYTNSFYYKSMSCVDLWNMQYTSSMSRKLDTKRLIIYRLMPYMNPRYAQANHICEIPM